MLVISMFRQQKDLIQIYQQFLMMLHILVFYWVSYGLKKQQKVWIFQCKIGIQCVIICNVLHQEFLMTWITCLRRYSCNNNGVYLCADKLTKLFGITFDHSSNSFICQYACGRLVVYQNVYKLFSVCIHMHKHTVVIYNCSRKSTR